MTTVTLFRQRGRYVGFSARGHADYAEEGRDIVCAAISALTGTAVIGLTEVLALKVAYELEEGDAYCMLPEDIPEDDFSKAELILRTMAMGMRSIADTYGDYIRIVEREV